MATGNLKIFLLAFIPVILFAARGYTQPGIPEKHILVSMRMIGHRILLNSGDSVSLVLPVKKEAGRYQIRFASDFELNPQKLVATVDSVVKATGIARRYIAEVEKCETGEVVYSFEMGNPAAAVIPCGARVQDKACYGIFISILDAPGTGLAKGSSPGKEQALYFIIALMGIAILSLAGWFKYSRRKKMQQSAMRRVDADMLTIGEYVFDRMNSELLIKGQSVELSAKESDLLFLLYNAANTTVEREVILRNVWGDEGDYIGRTLDVFISKLRRKLEADGSVKIVNIRGIGYKLVMNVHL